MRRSVRRFVRLGIAAYDLASTIPPSPAYERKVHEKDERRLDASRRALLDFGVDVRAIVTDFLAELEMFYGRKRADILRRFLADGYARRFSYYQQQKLRADLNELRYRIQAGGYWRNV